MPFPVPPFPVEVPDAHRPAVHAILAVMRDELALTAESLTGARLRASSGVPDAPRWMVDAGLVPRTGHCFRRYPIGMPAPCDQIFLRCNMGYPGFPRFLTPCVLVRSD
jgi:hypothetical protein